MKCLKIGITGGIGSGKSVVSRLFEQMNIPVYNSDNESKRLTMSNVAVKEGLIELLGNNVYIDGILNKQLLASYLFSSAENAKKIESIIHPVVKNDFKDWCNRYADLPVVAMESAILIESGFTDEVDFVVLITAPQDIRLKRAMQRDGVSESQIKDRIAAQLSDEDKEKFADYIIVNDGKTPLIPQVLELFTFLSQNNVYLCDAKK